MSKIQNKERSKALLQYLEKEAELLLRMREKLNKQLKALQNEEKLLLSLVNLDSLPLPIEAHSHNEQNVSPDKRQETERDQNTDELNEPLDLNVNNILNRMASGGAPFDSNEIEEEEDED